MQMFMNAIVAALISIQIVVKIDTCAAAATSES